MPPQRSLMQEPPALAPAPAPAPAGALPALPAPTLADYSAEAAFRRAQEQMRQQHMARLGIDPNMRALPAPTQVDYSAEVAFRRAQEQMGHLRPRPFQNTPMSGATPPELYSSQLHPSMIPEGYIIPDLRMSPSGAMRQTVVPNDMPTLRNRRPYIHTEGPPDLARGFEAPDIAPMAPGPSQRAIGLASGLAGAGGMMSLAGGSQPVPQMTPAYPPMMTPMQQPSAPAPAPAPAPPLPSRPPVDEKKLEEEMLRALED